MTYSDTAEFRRANRQPGYGHIPRDEYIQRAHEFAPRGERLSKKLTAYDILAIRANVNGLTDKRQSERYGVSPSMIYKIRKRERWGCL